MILFLIKIMWNCLDINPDELISRDYLMGFDE